MEQLLGFSWAELLWCHKWSWWCLWTLHSQLILLVHSAAPSTPHPPRPHTHCQHQDLPSSPPHLSVSKIRRAELKTGDAARQVSFLKHPTLVSMQRWPKTDINNRSLINLYRSSSQSFPLLSASLLGGIVSWERYSTPWTCKALSKQKIEHVVGSRWKANSACIWI